MLCSKPMPDEGLKVNRNVATGLPIKNNMSYRGQPCARWERQDPHSGKHVRDHFKRNSPNFWKTRKCYSQHSLKQIPDNARKRDQTNEPNQKDPEREKFRALVKKLFELLRSFHHLEKIPTRSEVEPPTFSRLTQYLTGVIKPANMTPQTKSLLEGNARNWAYTTHLILQNHYEQHVDQVSEVLPELMIEDWGSALAVATKWYHKRYAKKSTEVPIKKVKALMQALVGSGVEETVGMEIGTTTCLMEDFPTLTRDAGKIIPITPQGDSSTPSALTPLKPQRAPRQRKQRQVVLEITSGRDNLPTQSCPDTQENTILPLIQERQAGARRKSPIQEEVHVQNNAVEQLEVIQPTSPTDSLCQVPSKNLEGSSVPELLIDLDGEPLTSPADSLNEFRPVKHLRTAKKIVFRSPLSPKLGVRHGRGRVSRSKQPPHSLGSRY